MEVPVNMPALPQYRLFSNVSRLFCPKSCNGWTRNKSKSLYNGLQSNMWSDIVSCCSSLHLLCVSCTKLPATLWTCSSLRAFPLALAFTGRTFLPENTWLTPSHPSLLFSSIILSVRPIHLPELLSVYSARLLISLTLLYCFSLTVCSHTTQPFYFFRCYLLSISSARIRAPWRQKFLSVLYTVISQASGRVWHTAGVH